MIHNEPYDYPDLRPCSNGIYCVTNHSLDPQPRSTTSIMLSINRQIHTEIIMYLLYKFDIYLIHDRVTVCLGHDTQHLYLHPLPLLPSKKGMLSSLRELWIIAGQFSFPDLNDILPYLHNLSHINLDHDMTNETLFANPNIFLIDYCNSSSIYHYPSSLAQIFLACESKQALESKYLLPTLGDHKTLTELLALAPPVVRPTLSPPALSLTYSRIYGRF